MNDEHSRKQRMANFVRIVTTVHWDNRAEEVRGRKATPTGTNDVQSAKLLPGELRGPVAAELVEAGS